MPTVPVISTPSVPVRRSGTPFQRVPGATPSAFGAGIGRATESAGRGIQQNADELALIARQKKTRDDERDAKREFLEHASSLQEIRTNFLASEGQNTLDSFEEVLANADALGKERVESISENKRVREAVQLAIQAERLQFQKQVDAHLLGQKRVVDDAQFDALIIDATNDGIEAYKSFGADDESLFEDSFSGDLEDAFDDGVRVNELSIRRLAEDKAKRDGDLVDAKVEEAVAKYYDSVIRAALPDDPSIALKIFNGSREKIRGERGIKLKKLLKTQTTGSVSLMMARSIFSGVAHLPPEQQLGAALKEVRKITDYDTFVKTKILVESRLKSDAQVKGLEAPPLARQKVLGLLASGMSTAEVAVELNKTEDLISRKAELSFLASLDKINTSAKKEVAEDFAGQVYRMEDDDVAEAERLIKRQFKDDPESEGIALAHLKSLADVDESLLKTDLPSKADKTKTEIIRMVTNSLPSGASNAEQKAAAILEAEKIEDPGEKLLVIVQLNSFYSSLAGFDSEKAQDAGADLIEKISQTEKTQVGLTEAILGSDVNSKTKTAAIANMRSLDVAARKDEKAAKNAAASAMSAAMASGQSPAEFRASSPENTANYDIVATDGPLMSGMVSSFRLAAEGQEFPFVSHPSATNEIRDMTEDELVNLDRERFKGFLNRDDTNTLASRQRGAVSKREIKNARVATSVTRNINRLQPYNKKGKPKLTKGVLAKVDNYVWTQIADAQKAGLTPGEEDVKKMVIAAFTVVEFSPDDPGFFESIFGLDRGGNNKDVAGALIAEMSDDELNTLRVDEDNFPTEMDRFLQIAVDGWKRRNVDSGEPSEDDLELLRGNVLKFVLRNRGNR